MSGIPVAEPESGQGKKKRKFKLLLISLVLGSTIGVGSAAAVAIFFARSYVESPKFWQDISKSVGHGSGLEISAASTELAFFPPGLHVRELQGVQGVGGPRLFFARDARISLSFLPLLTGVGSLRVVLSELTVSNASNEKSTPAKPSSSAGFSPPLLPLRRIDLALTAADVRLPVSYMPKTDIELQMSASSSLKGADLKLERLRLLGITVAGEVSLNAQGAGKFTLSLPEKESLISGSATGELSQWGTKIRASGALKLPDTKMGIPAGVQWLAAAKPVVMKGSAALGGGVKFSASYPDNEWTADGSWNLDLTAAAISYAQYDKPVGTTAAVTGRVEGSAVHWKLSGLAVKLGQAHAVFDAESKAGESTHVIGTIAPFEIGEFARILLKDEKQQPLKGAVSGTASAKIDINLPQKTGGDPSGTIQAALDDWMLDGAVLSALVGEIPQLSMSGRLHLKAKVNATIDQGTFREAAVKVSSDAKDFGIAYGELFRKKVGVPLALDAVGEGSGKSVLIKGVRLQGPGGLRLVAKGNVVDLKDYLLKLQILESVFPLDVVASFIPKAASAFGRVKLDGELQGSLKNPKSLFAKLHWGFKSVALEHETFSLKKLNGSLETVMGEAMWIVRTPDLSLQLAPKLLAGEEITPVDVRLHGHAEVQDKAISGDMTANLSDLNAEVLLAAMPAKSAEEGEPAAAAPLVDLKRSKFRLGVETPRIHTPYLDITEASAVFRVGGPELTLEKIAGHALDGDLVVKGKVKPSEGATPMHLDLSVSGQHLAMAEVSRLVMRLSGKNMESSIFGTADLNISGSMDKGLASADFKGEAEIKDGGFKFLPLPRKTLDEITHLRVLADKLPMGKDTGAINDKLEKAKAKFHLKGEKVDLEIETIDSTMAMTASGFVTLGGHCEMKGRVVPKEKLVGKALVASAPNGFPFTSVGDQWACSPKPEYGELIKQAATAQIEEHKAEVIDKAKGALKGLFGK